MSDFSSVLKQKKELFLQTIDSFFTLLDYQQRTIMDQRFTMQSMRGVSYDGNTIHELWDTDIRQITYSSLYLSLFSFLEYKMKNLSHSVEVYKNSTLGHQELGGKILKYIRYLEIQLDFNKDVLDPYRIQLLRYNALRNSYVHHGGILKRNGIDYANDALVSFIRETNGIEIEADDSVQIRDKAFLIEFMRFISIYYGAVITDLIRIVEIPES